MTQSHLTPGYEKLFRVCSLDDLSINQIKNKSQMFFTHKIFLVNMMKYI